MANQQAQPNLDGLPAEIKLVILKNMFDLGTLRDLTHSVPAYHRLYVDVKREVLNAIANRAFVKLEIDFLDPLTAIDAARYEGIEVDDNRQVAELFSAWRTDLPSVIRDPKLSIHQSLAIIQLQRDFEQLASRFLEQVYLKIPKLDIISSHQPLTSTESRRMVRAFSRLEIYGKVFGEPSIHSYGYHGKKFPDLRERARLFLSPLPKHEVEELHCAYRFTEYQWIGLLDIVKNEAAEEHYQIGDWGDTFGECLEEFTTNMKAMSLNLASMGPCFLSKALRSDKPTLLALVKPHLTAHIDTFQQLLWMISQTSERGPILMGPGHEPSVGWLWTRRSEKDFRIPRGSLLNDIGYAIWDQERFEAWNITREDMLTWGGKELG